MHLFSFNRKQEVRALEDAAAFTLVLERVPGPLTEVVTPALSKKYLDLAPQMKEAITAFQDEISSGAFPAPEHSFASDEDFSSLLKE